METNDLMQQVEFPHRLQPDDWVCFLHISKTGGLTMLPLLDSMFMPEERCTEHNVKLLPIEELRKYKLLRSHGTYDDFRRIWPHPPVWLTYLREPIERAFSTYKYMIRTPEHEIAHLVKGMSFDDFVFGPPAVTSYIDDYQTRILTSTLDPSEKPDLDLAMKRLKEEFLFVGLTEDYERSLELMSYSLYWPPALKVERRNVTPDPLRRSDIAPKTLDKLLELNERDIQLYECGKEIYTNRYREMMQNLLTENAVRFHQPTSVVAATKDFDEVLTQHRKNVDELLKDLKSVVAGGR